MKILPALLLPLIVTSSWAFDVRVDFQPKPDEPRSTLIWYNSSTATQWAEKLDNYLEVYRTPYLNKELEGNMVECTYDSNPRDGKACAINPQSFGPCVNTNYFGYRRYSPCVFIEIDQAQWSRRKSPYYNSTKDLPESMPYRVKQNIEDYYAETNTMEALWISCEGESAVDVELAGPISYHPFPGFPGYLLPYEGQPGYLNPIVAVQFKYPSVGVLISIQCKLWAKGLTYNKKENIGMVSFELLID